MKLDIMGQYGESIMALDGRGKRDNTRTCLAVTLVCIPVGFEADKPKDYLVGTTFDISDSGLSFYTKKPLLDGDDIEILCEALWNKPKTGTVRWCKTLNYNCYLVGVSLQ
jgi:hypothetical protein